MDWIVAFSLPDEALGVEAMSTLKDLDAVKDVVLVYRDSEGAHLRQTSDVTAADAAMVGGVIGAVIGVLSGPVIALAAGGTVIGAFYGAVRDKGVEDGLMMLAGKRLADDQVAVFVLTDEPSARHILATVKGYAAANGLQDQVSVGSFPARDAGSARKALGGEGSRLSL